MTTKANTTAKAATATKAAPKKPAAKAAPKAKPAPIKAAAPAKPAVKKPDAAALAAELASQRKHANAVFAKLNSAVSVPVKPFAAFKRTYKADVQAHAIGRKPSARQAAALAVALTASGKQLRDNVSFPRKFTMQNDEYAIENGALSSAISAGLATYDSATETVTIVKAAEIKSQLGAALGSFKL